MIKEVKAKVLLSRVKQPDTWFGLHYNFNIYRGCEHQCIYCDSRSECYQIEDFRDVLVKVNAVEVLRQELARKRTKGIIGTGSMSDPYTRAETAYGLTRGALAAIAEYGFGIHLITKSDLALRDLDILQKIVSASVSFTVTTGDDELARLLEPGAPPPSARFAAMKTLAAAGINTGVTMMPLLPYLEDNEANIAGIVERTAAAGGRYIIPAFGVTMRDRQCAYFYRALDGIFPGLSARYRAKFGQAYECECENSKELQGIFADLCRARGIATRFTPPTAGPVQLPLWGGSK